MSCLQERGRVILCKSKSVADTSPGTLSCCPKSEQEKLRVNRVVVGLDAESNTS